MTGMLAQFAPVGTREAIERDALWERLLLVAYAYGTNTGIGAVAQGDHGHSESDVRYVDSRGQSEIGFAITSLLDFDLLPRIKADQQDQTLRPRPGNLRVGEPLGPSLVRRTGGETRSGVRNEGLGRTSAGAHFNASTSTSAQKQ